MFARLPACMRRFAVPVTLGTLVAGGALAFWKIKGPDWQASYWQSRLDDAEDDKVEAALAADHLARLGMAGIAALVDELNCDRAEIALESKRALLGALARIESAEPDEAEEYRLALARALDEQIDAFAPPAKTIAAELATRILTAPQRSDSPQSTRTTALCDRVLRAKSGYADAELEPADQHARQASITSMLAQPHLTAAPEPEGLRRPKLPPVAERLAWSQVGEPAMLSAPADARALASVDYLGHKPKAKTIVDSEVQTVSAVVPVEDTNRMAKLPGIELFKLLADPSGHDIAAVRAEIKRRKFTPREIEVGTHLCSSVADERCRWAEALPGLSGIDAKMWLLWLSHDASPRVRLTAVTLMATASDPELQTRVAEMARSDRDERVQAQAAHLLEQAEDN